MKTHIIQLEQHDDLVSVRDKMSWAKSQRILLVWPPGRRVNIRPLDLVLLKRHADSLGAQLGIATRLGEIHQSAAEAGIPVFQTSGDAQRHEWAETSSYNQDRNARKPRLGHSALKEMRDKVSIPEPAWSKLPQVRLAVFSTGVLAVLLFLFLFVPSATVSIKPVTQVQTISIPLSIDPETTVVALSGVVPAYPIDVTIQGEGEIPATGTMTFPASHAIGVVVFTNLTELPIQIPEGTIVRTTSSPSVRFEVTRVGEIAATVGESIELPVRALEGGLIGNVQAGDLQTIEGSLGLSLSATNPDPATGGEEARKPAATENNRTKLFSLVEESNSAEAQAEISKQLPAGGHLISGLLISKTQAEVYEPPLGSPGPKLALALTQDYRAYYINDEDLLLLGNMVLDASLPEGFIPVPDSTSVELIGEPVHAGDGSINWHLSASRTISAKLDGFDVTQLVLGKSPKSALRKLSAMNSIDTAVISLSPSWWFWLPALPMRITVSVEP